MTDRVGEQFGEYRLNNLLGSGSFAEVYKAEHIRSGEEVAVKLLYGVAKEDFLKEARIAASLNHPNIVDVLGFGVERDTPYLVMSYAPNGSLDQRYPRGSVLPLSTIISYVKQVADALQYAHEHRVIHRDIKPANLLLGREGQVLVADFGIAELDHRTISWQEQKVAGTHLYMAPEQYLGRAKPASDQYSLGIMVYQWLCGNPPFLGTIFTLPPQHANNPPPPFGEKVFHAVGDVIFKTLAKEPRQRFSSVEDFARALEQAYMTEIKWRLSIPGRAGEVLMQEDVQHIFSDLIVGDPNWWNAVGRAVIRGLRDQANHESQANLAAVLSTLARRAVSRAEVIIQYKDVKTEDEASFVNLLSLVDSATPPFVDPDIWTSLLESFADNLNTLTFITSRWEIHSWLLERWGRVSLSVENKYLRLWFPKTWPDFWRFLTLRLPAEWYDKALADLLDASVASPLPALIVRSIEQDHVSLIEDYLDTPFRSQDQQRIALRLFTKLVESGYARKMDLIHTLITSGINTYYTRDFVEQVLLAAQLTQKESIVFLERYGESIQSYYQLPIMVDYVRHYLRTFSSDDLDRASARELVRFISGSSSLPLPQEIRALAQTWHTITAFIERPVIGKQELLTLAYIISQLPPATRIALIDKLVASFISCIESEIDLMSVIGEISTVFAEPELLGFLYQMAAHAGEEYQLRRSEDFLVPYIRVALQPETFVHHISNAEQQEFMTQFFNALLQHADKRTYKRLNSIAHRWPSKLSKKWDAYASSHNPTSRWWPIVIF